MKNQSPSMFKDKLLTFFTAALFLLGFGTIGYVFLSNYLKNKEVTKVGVLECVSKSAQVQMRDEWMQGILEKGQRVEVLKNFYKCNPIQREDLVWFRISPPLEPVIKIVRGIPGDKFEVHQDEKDPMLWKVKINDEWVKGLEGPYHIRADHPPPLKTYQISSNRKGVLREGEYILLSNKSPGQSDSGNLGIIRGSTIEGKVMPLAEPSS